MALDQKLSHSPVDPAGKSADAENTGQNHPNGKPKLNGVGIDNRFHKEIGEGRYLDNTAPGLEDADRDVSVC